MEVVEFKRRKHNAELQAHDNETPADAAHRADVARRSRTYDRSTKLPLKGVFDKKLKTRLSRSFRHAKEAAREAARAELLRADDAGALEAETAMEKTFKVTQAQLRAELPAQAAAKAFALALPAASAPYACAVSRDGRHTLLGGARGHVVLLDRLAARALAELELHDAVRDVVFLHNFKMFAAAQRRYTYIYDSHGTELHRLKHHIDVTALDFLPYHYLLVSAGNAGWLKYQDVSTGWLVAEHRTRLGPVQAMRQNPRNAVMHLGHTNGTVTLWTPNLAKPAVSIFTGPGAVQALSVAADGNYMATAAVDGRVRVWDLRTYKPVHSQFVYGRPTSLDISQRGMLAVGFGNHVDVYARPVHEHSPKPYMHQHMPGSAVRSVRFAPYDDVLCVGHEQGFASLVVPGSGEPNFDTYVASPYETSKQMREREVQSLLEKVQPHLISLDDVLGRVTVRRHAGAKVQRREMRRKGQLADDDNDDDDDDDESGAATDSSNDAEDSFERDVRRKKKKMANKAPSKGKNKPGRVAAKKQALVGQRTREMIKEQNVQRLEETRRQRNEQRMREFAEASMKRKKKKNKKKKAEAEASAAAADDQGNATTATPAPPESALARFEKKKRKRSL